MANKRIRFGIKNLHAAFITQGDTLSAVKYGDMMEIPGAKTMSLEPQGENLTENADDIDWFTQDINNGYSGTIEIEDTAEGDAFIAQALGQTKEESGMLLEKATDEAAEFALLGEFTLAGGGASAANGKRFCLFRCKASRLTIAGDTKAGTTITVNTNTLTITALPRINDNYVKASCVSTDTCYSTWFDSVPEPTGIAAESVAAASAPAGGETAGATA